MSDIDRAGATDVPQEPRRPMRLDETGPYGLGSKTASDAMALGRGGSGGSVPKLPTFIYLLERLGQLHGALRVLQNELATINDNFSAPQPRPAEQPGARSAGAASSMLAHGHNLLNEIDSEMQLIYNEAARLRDALGD